MPHGRTTDTPKGVHLDLLPSGATLEVHRLCQRECLIYRQDFESTLGVCPPGRFRP